jgi:hypothetical protein
VVDQRLSETLIHHKYPVRTQQRQCQPGISEMPGWQSERRAVGVGADGPRCPPYPRGL